ncbi:MAG: hypothetical protein MRY78_09570 [Saprospiraceae bacterium]|nr:hypothetical protein [Saprospiraceae bacterium]
MLNKKLLLLLSLTLISLTWYGCDNEDDVPEEPQPGVAQLVFNASFQDQLLTMFEDTYDYEDGIDLRFQLFNFYLSDITLVSPEMGDVVVKDVDLVSFKDIYNAEDAAKGIRIDLGEVPETNYTGVKFGIGVKESLNATQPSDYELGHPLSPANYWSWASGYVFFKIEGNADLDGDGVFENDDKLTFHIGNNEYYRQSSFDKTFSVQPNDTTLINFEVDVYDMLVDESTGEYLNFKEVKQDHTTNPEVAGFLADQLQQAIKIQ